ncbi:MAG TPA: M56 family metallopeptidase [Pirellulales bacterium]|nr:M56 family metallopeptidase [Pirellulales bacterium]
MTWLMAIGLTNAVLASLLAFAAWGVGRCCKRPALTRLLWVVVLCKLFAPPLAQAPVGDWLAAPRRWLAEVTPNAVTQVGSVTASIGREPGRSMPGNAVLANQAGTTSGEPAAQESVTPSVSSVGATSAGTSSAAGTMAVRSSPTRAGWWAALTSVSPANYLLALSVVWFTGSALSLVWLARRTWRFRRFLAQVAHEDTDLSQRVASLARQAGLRSSPRVLVVDSAVSPMLWGAGRSACLLFPTELVRRIDDDACDTLLLHELSHYARADWLVRVLELAAQVVYWWHPLVWWARREIEAVEEECCDAWVVDRQSASPRTYAEALLATVDFLCEPTRALPPAACGLGAAPLLRSRLTNIMCGDVTIQPSRLAKISVLAAAAVVLPLGPAFVGSAPKQAEARSTTHETMLPTLPVQPAVMLKPPPEAQAPVSSAPGETAKQGNWFVRRDPLRVGPVLYATAVSPNGRYRLEARTGHRVALVDVERDDPLNLSFYRILSASYSPDSRLLATAQDDEGVVRLWDCENGENKTVFKGSDAAITSVAFAPDGQRVAAGATDGSVLVWSVIEEEPVARLPRQDAPIGCLRWSKEGDRLAVSVGDWSDHDSSSIVIWQPAGGIVSREFSIDQATGALEWLADDELIVADWSGDARVMNLMTGIAVESLWIGKDKVSAAAFSTDCPLLPRWQANRLAEDAGR